MKTLALRLVRLIALLLLTIIYMRGCSEVNASVRDSCTHGNCVHGWYSKFNEVEKAVAFAWMVGFPIIALGLASALYSTPADQARDMERRQQAEAERATALREQRGAKLLFATFATSRKPWNCLDCDKRFDAGTKYCYYETWFDSRATRMKFCASCRERLLHRDEDSG